MAARGTRKPKRWIDPRLVIGMLLVGASIAGTVTVVVATNRQDIAYTAAAALAPGQIVGAEQLTAAEVTLAASAGLYLSESTVPDGDFVITQPIRAGELIPLSAVGDADTALSAIVVTVSGGIPSDVRKGTTVELWASAETSPGDYGAPVLATAEARVGLILPREGALASSREERVELVVQKSEVPALLAIVGSEARLSLVPVYLSQGG